MRVVGNLSKMPKRVPTVQELLSQITIPTPKDGRDGLQGPTGPKGDKGDSVSLDELLPLVEALVKSEIEKIELPEGADSIVYNVLGGGGPTPVAYITTITTNEYRINKNELRAGTNIFGVNYAGDVTVYLPEPHEELKSKIIIVNDESASAATNNITITTTGN
jgi:hypothetical protein